MHDTYDEIGSMYQYKQLWELYGKNSKDINGKIAYEMDKIQAIYQFYTYFNQKAKFKDENLKSWKNEKNKITTTIGLKILQEIVLDRLEK